MHILERPVNRVLFPPSPTIFVISYDSWPKTWLIKLFPLYLGSALGILSELINFRYLSPLQAIILVIGGTFIGLSGSLTSLSRFLKV
jgi:hypothetical protein